MENKTPIFPDDGLSQRTMLEKLEEARERTLAQSHAFPETLKVSFRYDSQLFHDAQNTTLSVNKDPSPFYMLSYHLNYLQAGAEHTKLRNIVASLDNTPGRQDIIRHLTEQTDTWFISTGETKREGAFLLVRSET
jgi:hypothetical protein